MPVNGAWVYLLGSVPGGEESHNALSPPGRSLRMKASVLPSELKTTDVTVALCPSNVCRNVGSWADAIGKTTNCSRIRVTLFPQCYGQPFRLVRILVRTMP